MDNWQANNYIEIDSDSIVRNTLLVQKILKMKITYNNKNSKYVSQ
jgi:hypothetical protein